MTDYYVDSVNGAPANGGTSWADALDTLNGAEDLPVSAGDTVHCRGEFPEQLTCDVSGSAGNPITYQGYFSDTTSELPRITGSDDDQTATRGYNIFADGKNYRAFIGFQMDTTTTENIRLDTGCNHWTIADCAFQSAVGSAIQVLDAGLSDILIERCLFPAVSEGSSGIIFNDAAGTGNAASIVRNCLFIGNGYGIGSVKVGGIAVNACLFLGLTYGIRVITALPGGYTAITSANSNYHVCSRGVYALSAGEITEDYNNFWDNNTARTNVSTGGNSVAYAPLMEAPPLVDGYEYAWWLGKLSQWSALRSLTGSGMPSDDLFGITRAGAPSSWGPIEYTSSPTRRDWDSGTSRGRRGT